jgi:hypothetical protein
VNDATVDALSIEAAKTLRKRLSLPPRLELLLNIRAAAGSRNLFSRLMRATWGPGKLSTHEFFYYRLYEASVPNLELDRYVGKAVQHRLHMACNNVEWFAACHDKILWSTILAGAGLRAPDTLAVFGKIRPCGTSACLDTEDELRRFIADPANHPLFCKPVDGINSIGAIRIEGVVGDTVAINGGQLRHMDEIVGFMRSLSTAGYLLQRALIPSPVLDRITGTAVASIRFLVLFGDQGPVVESAVVKLPRRNEVADNYWREGNMLGAVDLESGSLVRIVSGTGANFRSLDVDPESATVLKGSALPDFASARTLCLDAAAHFAGIRTQSWDVALTADGPVLLELNFGGDVNLHQLAHRRGILSDTYCRHLKHCGYKGRLPSSTVD